MQVKSGILEVSDFAGNERSVQNDAPIEDLLPILRADHVPIVVDGDTILGLFTRIDLLNYLRRRMK